MSRNRNVEVAAIQMHVLYWRHLTRLLELLNLRLGEIARWAAHGVEGFEHIAVIVIDPKNLHRC